MILDELVLENVGTFRGKHKITLTPPSDGKPVVLIGGLNGAGKTTILEAVHLALYGSLAQVSGRRTGSYESYLRRLIHHGVSPQQGAAVQLTFHARQQGVERQFKVRRRWMGTDASLREILLVNVNDRYDEALTATWNEHVETFLPRGIAGLFFFDGEQIEALADLDRSKQVMGSAIAALLGLDLVDRLATDLAVLRRRHRSSELPEGMRQTIEDRQQTATLVRQAEEAAANVVATARVESERADKRLHSVTERYRGAGGDLLDQRETAEARVAMNRQQLTEVEEDLRRELAEESPLLLVQSLLVEVSKLGRAEADASRDRAVADVLVERDRLVLGQLRGMELTQKAVQAVEQFLADDVAQRQQSSSTEAVVTGLNDPGVVEGLVANGLPTIDRRLRTLIERRAAVRADLDQAERTLVAIPDPESLAPLREELDEASNHAVRAHAGLVQADDRLAALRQERGKADTAYEAALDKATNASLAADDDRRVVEHVDKVRATLDSLKLAATRRHVERIGALILESLDRLMRKDGLITGVKIDPETFAVELSGPNGRVMQPQELSAGERQLLAVAMLWGLARAAGQPLPMIIDTPLGRLDGTHREHLLDRYFPHASHQVVLLSTDTEIDLDALARIQRYIGRSYQLEFDPATNATSIEPGYFWE